MLCNEIQNDIKQFVLIAISFRVNNFILNYVYSSEYIFPVLMFRIGRKLYNNYNIYFIYLDKLTGKIITAWQLMSILFYKPMCVQMRPVKDKYNLQFQERLETKSLDVLPLCPSASNFTGLLLNDFFNSVITECKKVRCDVCCKKVRCDVCCRRDSSPASLRDAAAPFVSIRIATRRLSKAFYLLAGFHYFFFVVCFW